MDPYKVLGIERSATDDEVKQAYRKLAKKYHPDRYQNSPLAESASEKMKEVNAAYDQIVNERKNGGSSRGSSQSYYGSYSDGTASGGGASRFNNIRMLINQGNFEQAEKLLSEVESTERDAEWYYLMGIVYYRKGRLEEAYNYIATACQKDPTNVEYRSIYNRIRAQRSGASGGYTIPTSSCTGSTCGDICGCVACMVCVDILSNLFKN